MKLLKDNKALHAEEFSNASPYVIMFGPDKCGATNKVGQVYHWKCPSAMLSFNRSISSSNTRTPKLVNMRRSTLRVLPWHAL